MPKQKIDNLISTLHDQFGDDLTSPQQQQLMDSMKSHIHNWGEGQVPDPGFRETVEVLIEDLEQNHPQAASIAREVLQVLNNIGI